MNAIETHGLGKRYGRTWALRDCTLAIPAGRVAALIGPNGAGKTTLMQLAVGLIGQSTGRRAAEHRDLSRTRSRITSSRRSENHA